MLMDLLPPDNMHSASTNVYILDQHFWMPQLQRTRRIWLYLPSSYQRSGKRYPVLYMQDGQNLFDNETAYAGEWGVDEVLDNLSAECIVVGIDNGGDQRMTEYNVHDNAQFGKGEGEAYLSFIADTLKPTIDQLYRTLPGKKDTFIAGSSMGGLISFYGGLYYPKIFGGIGVLSPSFVLVPEVEQELIRIVKRRKFSKQKYYFYVGGAENAAMIGGMTRIAGLMQKLTRADIRTSIAEEGQHNEQSWGKAFPDFFQWIMGKR